MEMFDGMSSAEVEDLLEQLVAFAASLLRKRVWRGGSENPPPGGHEAVDIVHDLVVSYADGTRQLNSDVDLKGNLMGGVRSRVNTGSGPRILYRFRG